MKEGNKMKKVISLVLAVAMLVGMMVTFTGCGGGSTAKDDGVFTVYGFNNPPPGKSELMAEIEAEQAARCEYPVVPMNGDIQMIMASGDYPDIIPCRMFDDATVSKYAAQGILIALDEYISEENTPNIWRMFTEQPTTKAVATSPDGHIYALPSYQGMASGFVETYWYINDAWLKKLGLETPTTIPELTEVLRAFKKGDPNGNGKADEIPFGFFNTGSSEFPETLLSCWGVDTKFGMYDSYLTIDDGDVFFAPVMDEWKEMIKTYAMWYKEGLLDIECMSQESNTWSSKLAANPPIVGCTFFTAQNPFEAAEDEYKVIKPISADGTIKPNMHLHPGSLGTKNMAYVTSACEDPAAALRWLDTWYSTENTIDFWYGNESFDIVDGMYKWKDPKSQGYETISEMYYANTPAGPTGMGYLNMEVDRGTLIEDCDVFQQNDALYEMYKEYMDFTPWPRPYYAPEDATKIANLQTDIFNTVEENKANWILGRADVEKDWDKYIEQMSQIGLDEYLEIMQKTYDVFQKTMDEIGK